MIFRDSTNLSAYYFPFNWGAEYLDGSYLTEFDLVTKEKNDFYSIQQHKLNRFGLFGCGFKFNYNIDGAFNLHGEIIEIEYHIGDIVYPLKSTPKDRDCIAYKRKEMFFHPDLSLQSDQLVSVDFGYKTLLNYDGIQFFFQPIVKLPVNKEDGKVQIEVKMTSNLDLHGKLVFKNKGEIIDAIDCDLIRNHAAVVDWIVH